MNPSVKNVVVAGIVALVVAIGVVLGARGLSPDENSGVAPVVVTAIDGSVVGMTAPIRASSGPPVPACTTLNTVLTCEGAGSNFQWHFPIGGGDSGIANEAFGAMTLVNTDAGYTVIGKATLTPDQTGEVSITSSLYIPFGDASCPFEGGISSNNGIVITYGLHNADAASSVPISSDFLNCVNLTNLAGTGNVVTANASGAIGGLVNDGGTSYDFLMLGGGAGGVIIPDGAAGGIWVHEVP